MRVGQYIDTKYDIKSLFKKRRWVTFIFIAFFGGIPLGLMFYIMATGDNFDVDIVRPLILTCIAISIISVNRMKKLDKTMGRLNKQNKRLLFSIDKKQIEREEKLREIL